MEWSAELAGGPTQDSKPKTPNLREAPPGAVRENGRKISNAAEQPRFNTKRGHTRG